MSTEEKKPDAPAADAAAAPAKKKSPIGAILGIIVPAVLAAGAAFGGTRLASAHAPAAAPEHPHGEHLEPLPPGPTLPLDPFLLTLFDANKKAHPMRVSLAVEFDSRTHEDLKTFVPRIRDAIIAHLRTLTTEDATDPAHMEKLRAELLEKCKGAGAAAAQRVLITDFVVQ